MINTSLKITFPSRQEVRQTTRDSAAQPDESPYYASFAKVSKSYRWADGQSIYIKNGDTTYMTYRFKRTGQNPSDGIWLNTGVEIDTALPANW